MATNPDTRLLQTALTLIEGYNKWDIDAIMAPRAPNCVQRVYPARLDRPSLTNDEYRSYFASLMPLIEGFTVTVLDTVVDAKAHMVAIYAKSRATTAIGPYGNEYSLFLRMTEDDTQIIEFKEFVDSEYSQNYFAKLREHHAKGKEEGQ